MPCLYCDRDGRERETDIITQQDLYREEGETVLVTSGRLIRGPMQCDRCNAELKKGDLAWLVSAYPSHCRDELCGYDFAYERQYFAMGERDQVAAYGAQWPDDSIRNRQKARSARPSQVTQPCLCPGFPGAETVDRLYRACPQLAR